MIEQFRQLEESLLDADLRRSPQRTDALLDPGFFEFGQSGAVWSREAVISALAEEWPLPRALRDFAARALSDDVVLVTYRSMSRDPETGIEKQALRSSIWVRRDERWRMAFHQGTPIPTGR